MSSDSMTWHRVASRSKLTPANPLAVEVGDKLIGLYLVDDTVYAIGNLCTHEFALLTEGFVEGDAIECPLHQARFSIKTGKVLSEPADTDVPSYPVKVTGDDIFVGV
jgi:nitrite reductase/ring-hydroxylating ferredoxin subunit